MAIKKYYALVQNGSTADIYIYGDITSFPWDETDVSSYGLAKELESLVVEQINCYINSYGGEVAEGLAIYNQLKRNQAKVTTICDGFACSAASVIFMAGDERIMGDASLLMVHNAWSYASGNSEELRKQADDLDIITKASINAYLSCINIDEAALKKLLDEETWILPADALAMGFATKVTKEETGLQANQSIKKKVAEKLAKQPKGLTLNLKTDEKITQRLDEIDGNVRSWIDDIEKQIKEKQAGIEAETQKKTEEQPEEDSTLIKNLVAVLSRKG